MNDLVTIITPSKITSQQDFDTFKKCLDSFYKTFKKYNFKPLHLIRDDSPVNWHDELYSYLCDLQANFLFLESGPKGYLPSVLYLFEQIKTPFFFTIADDVMLCQKNFWQPSIKAMLDNEKLLYVKYGGGYFSSGSSNLHMFQMYDGKVVLNTNENAILQPTIVDGNVVWCDSLREKNIKNAGWMLTMWNIVGRTKTFQKIIKITKDRLGSDFGKLKSWDDLTQAVNGWDSNWDRVNLAFLREMYYGWLNCCSYLYAIGRINGPEDGKGQNMNDFFRTHTFEVKI